MYFNITIKCIALETFYLLDNVVEKTIYMHVYYIDIEDLEQPFILFILTNNKGVMHPILILNLNICCVIYT